MIKIIFLFLFSIQGYYSDYHVKQILKENGINIQKEWYTLIYRTDDLADVNLEIIKLIDAVQYWPKLDALQYSSAVNWETVKENYLWKQTGKELVPLIKKALKSYFQSFAQKFRQSQEDPYMFDMPQIPLKIEYNEEGVYTAITLAKLSQAHELLNVSKTTKINSSQKDSTWKNIVVYCSALLFVNQCLNLHQLLPKADAKEIPLESYGVKKITPFDQIGIYHQHVNQMYVLELEHHQSAIFKPHDERNLHYGHYKNEVAAYKLSKLFQLGEIVPPTILKRIDLDEYQNVEGSMQLFIDDSSTLYGDKSEIRKMIPKEINFLDLIIGNSDRHAKNVLKKVLEDGKVHYYAIDHDKSFHHFDKPASFMMEVIKDFFENPKNFYLSAKKISNLQKIEKSAFLQELKDLVPAEQINRAFERFEMYLHLYHLHNDFIMKTSGLSEFIGDSSKQSRSNQGTAIITLDSGRKAIFKWDTPKGVGTYKNEIFAFQLSQLLGYNKVPPTVERTLKINGETITGSLQLFIENTHIIYPDKIHFRDFDHPADVQFFDFILGQYKRHNGNIIFDKNNNYYLVDHSNTLRDKNRHKMLMELISQDPKDFQPTDEYMLTIFCTSKFTHPLLEFKERIATLKGYFCLNS